MAVVGDVLAGLDAQETQEAQLDHTDGLAIEVHVGELGGGGELTGGLANNQDDEQKNKKKGSELNYKSVTNLGTSGKLTVPRPWSLFVPGAHLHLPSEQSTIKYHKSVKFSFPLHE